MHSVRIFADDWRTARIASMGPLAWKGLYSVVALAGFVLIVYGYGMSRQSPDDLWLPPVWTIRDFRAAQQRERAQGAIQGKRARP